MKISFAILTHNETDSLRQLLNTIRKNVGNYEYEIVIVDDNSTTSETKNILKWAKTELGANIYNHSLNYNFAQQKNYLNTKCTGDYIFNLDADEIPPKMIVNALKELLQANPGVEAIWLPRINIVEGITDEHLAKWRWAKNEKNWINWPDPQCRIYKNSDHIFWDQNVHERPRGFETESFLPFEEEFAITHIKTINKQESQNLLYEEIHKGKYKDEGQVQAENGN